MISMTDQPTVPSSSCGTPSRSVTNSFGISGHTQLLLQVRARGRVAEDQLPLREAVPERLLAHQRRFVETRKDQLELAGVGANIADRENAGLAGLESLGVDGDEVAVEVEAPVGERPEFHLQAVEGEQGVAGNVRVLAVVALDRDA